MYGKMIRRIFTQDSPPEDESFYSKKKRELLVEDGALNSEEDAFMEGYEECFQEDTGEDDDWLLESDIDLGVV